MMARLYCVVVALLLLAEVFGLGDGASNPGCVARITRKGLDYARQYGVATLKKELSTIKLPDFSGSFKVGWIGSVSYEFTSVGSREEKLYPGEAQAPSREDRTHNVKPSHRILEVVRVHLKIHSFKLQNLDLSLHPGQGVRASLSDNYASVSGNWKVKTCFITLKGTYDLSVDSISISISLNLNKDQSGRPTASVAHCSNSIGHVSIYISGNLSWLLNLFHKRIENNLKKILNQEICKMVKKSTASYLEPYLQTLPVTLMIDQVAGIDYSLVGAPQVTSQDLDMPLKGEFFGRSQRSPVPFDAPSIRLPQKHEHMIYFAVSDYVFNTASRVYYQAGHMNFTIRNEHIPLDAPIRLHTKSLGAVVPQLARLYPNMELELEVSPESAPFLRISPRNVTLVPVMNIQAFALLPNSSDRKTLFLVKARLNISATINVSSSYRIVGSLTPGSKLKLELKHSSIGFFDVELMEAIFNFYASKIIYPSLNDEFTVYGGITGVVMSGTFSTLVSLSLCASITAWTQDDRKLGYQVQGTGRARQEASEAIAVLHLIMNVYHVVKVAAQSS
ncbi:Lipopolysaccharide-binding protein [Pteropus alecto]|uniref:Bactericidal permeability-increasing protein n=1 Tax=Pteropus alecto TaxID=9402 RepID=L5JXX0_PTEAL|nr:Lipopolysaccharide-binding protein [Pteropus alecto]